MKKDKSEAEAPVNGTMVVAETLPVQTVYPLDAVADVQSKIKDLSGILAELAKGQLALSENVSEFGKRVDKQLEALFGFAERLGQVETKQAEYVNIEKGIFKQLTPEQIAILNHPLPSEAISAPTKFTRGMCTIKAPYIIEIMNKVFGMCGVGWTLTSEFVSTSPKVKADSDKGEMQVVKAFLQVPAYGIYLESYGGNDNADKGDALKGAVTDAFTKMASYLGIGLAVFKGQGDKPSIEAERQEAKAANGTNGTNGASAPKVNGQAPAAIPQGAPAVVASDPIPVTGTAAPVSTFEEKGDGRTIGHTCVDCNQSISGWITEKAVYPAEQVLDRSQTTYKLDLCVLCLRKRKVAADIAGGGKVN